MTTCKLCGKIIGFKFRPEHILIYCRCGTFIIYPDRAIQSINSEEYDPKKRDNLVEKVF